jgi:hypothetical protein
MSIKGLKALAAHSYGGFSIRFKGVFPAGQTAYLKGATQAPKVLARLKPSSGFLPKGGRD